MAQRGDLGQLDLRGHLRPRVGRARRSTGELTRIHLGLSPTGNLAGKMYKSAFDPLGLNGKTNVLSRTAYTYRTLTQFLGYLRRTLT